MTDMKIKRDTSWIQEVETDGETIYFHKVVKNHCDFNRDMNPLDYELDAKPPIHDCVIVETHPDELYGLSPTHNLSYLADCDFCSEMHNGDKNHCCSEERTPKGVEYKYTHYYCTRHIREFEKAWTHDKQTTKNELSTKPQKPILEGNGVSIGTVTGKIGTDILLCDDMGSINHGTVLPFDVIGKTVGFICETGGATSHLAIVCRELKKPCIILRGAGEKLNDGDIITMDGSTGKIINGE